MVDQRHMHAWPVPDPANYEESLISVGPDLNRWYRPCGAVILSISNAWYTPPHLIFTFSLYWEFFYTQA